MLPLPEGTWDQRYPSPRKDMGPGPERPEEWVEYPFLSTIANANAIANAQCEQT